MPWVPLLAAAGVLFCFFAGTEWLLGRLNHQEERSPRTGPFLTAGALCLAAFSILQWAPRDSLAAASPANPAGTVSPSVLAAALEQRLAGDLALVEQIVQGQVPPDLRAIQGARRQVMQARRGLAAGAGEVQELRPLEIQGDALFGVAYQTLAVQWSLVKDLAWENPQARLQATLQLKGELEKWQTLAGCIRAGRTNCAELPAKSEREQALANLIQWLHPYTIELIRFEEDAPELTDLSPQERRRLLGLIAKARQMLAETEAEPWATPVVQAAQHLFQTAEAALRLESSVYAQGQWGATAQRRVYSPVRDAWVKYFASLLCANKGDGAQCATLKDS